VAKLKSAWLYYLPASMLCVCEFIFCCFRTNIRTHAAGISTYKYWGQISNAVSIIRGKKEMFEKNKIFKNKQK
jgi:hypothetical protein